MLTSHGSGERERSRYRQTELGIHEFNGTHEGAYNDRESRKGHADSGETDSIQVKCETDSGSVTGSLDLGNVGPVPKNFARVSTTTRVRTFCSNVGSSEQESCDLPERTVRALVVCRISVCTSPSSENSIL